MQFAEETGFQHFLQRAPPSRPTESRLCIDLLGGVQFGPGGDAGKPETDQFLWIERRGVLGYEGHESA